MPLDWFTIYAPVYDLFVRLAGVAPVPGLLDLVRLEPHESVLDVGGGTGRVARWAAEHGREVVVLDPCVAMLKRVPSKANIQVVQGRAQALPFEENRFDVVLCVDALHHIKDAPEAAAEMARVLKPGGRILVQEFDPRGWKGRAAVLFEHMVVDRSRFLEPAELEALFAAHGLPGTSRRRSWLEYAFLGRKVAL